MPVAAGDAKTAASIGTGWALAEGYVVTAHHVVAGAKKITLMRADGVEMMATLEAKDPANDLALLRVEDGSKLPAALPLAGKGPAIGERLFTVEYPLADLMGAKPKLTEGIVSSVTGFGDDPRTLQISAALQGGNSGGPVLNMRGEVIGIAIAKLNAIQVFKWTGDLPENVGYAVKTAYITPLLIAVPEIKKRPAVLPAKEAVLPELAERVQGSALFIMCE